jgi:hypothetical protein
MTVRELREELALIEDQEGIICVPDFSLCVCGARDGEYQARTITIKSHSRLHPSVVLE